MSFFKKITQVFGANSDQEVQPINIAKTIQQDIDDRLVRRTQPQPRHNNYKTEIRTFTVQTPEKVFSGTPFERPVLTARQIIYKNKIEPNASGLFPHEILVLEYSKKPRIKYFNLGEEAGVAGFWRFKYGVKDFSALLESLRERGLLEPKNNRWTITEKGEAAIKDSEYVLFIHQYSKDVEMTPWTWQNWLKNQPENLQRMNFRDQWWGYLNQRGLSSDRSDRFIVRAQMLEFLDLEAKEKPTASKILRSLNMKETFEKQNLIESEQEFKRNDRIMNDPHFSDDLRVAEKVESNKRMKRAIETAIAQTKKMSTEDKKDPDFKTLMDKISELKNR